MIDIRCPVVAGHDGVRRSGMTEGEGGLNERDAPSAALRVNPQSGRKVHGTDAICSLHRHFPVSAAPVHRSV